MLPKPFSIREALAVGWQRTKANFMRFFFILIITWIVSALVNGFSRQAGGHYALSGIISLLGWILLLLIQMGLLRATLTALDGGAPGLKDFSSSLSQFLNFAGASILCAIIVCIGFILLIIPGIFLAIRLQFYSYLVVEDGLGPVESLKRSWEMTQGQTWNLFVFFLTLLCIAIVGALLFGVGLLVAVPVIAVAAAFVYRKLRAAKPATAPVTPSPVPAA